MTISVHRKNLDPAYWSVSGSNLVSTPIVSYQSYFYVVDPSTVNSLSGTKISTFSVSQLQSNFGLVTSSNFTVTAADYADSNWASNGWTTGTDATFFTELSTFIQNNFGQQAINLNSSDVVLMIARGSIGGTAYSIPVLFYGNIGDPAASGISAKYFKVTFSNLDTSVGGSVALSEIEFIQDGAAKTTASFPSFVAYSGDFSITGNISDGSFAPDSSNYCYSTTQPSSSLIAHFSTDVTITGIALGFTGNFFAGSVQWTPGRVTIATSEDGSTYTTVYTHNFVRSDFSIGAEKDFLFSDSTDVFTTLLLPFDTANQQDISPSAHTVTYNSGAVVSAAQSKFGGGSMLLANTSSYVGISPTSTEIDVGGSSDFTMDFWFNIPAYAPGGIGVGSLCAYDADFHFGMLYEASGTNMVYCASSNGSSWDIFDAGASSSSKGINTISLNTWTHFAFVKSGSILTGYINGVQDIQKTGASNIVTRFERLCLGKWGNNDPRLGGNGYIDEFRFSKGIARWTTNFIPPVSAFTSDANTLLLLHFDNSLADSSSYNVPVATQGTIAYTTGEFSQALTSTNGFAYYTPSNTAPWNAIGTGDFTFEFWANATSINASASVVFSAAQQGVSNNWGLNLATNGVLGFYFNVGNPIINSPAGTFRTDGNWHHYAVVRLSGTVTFYVDGAVVSSGSFPTAMPSLTFPIAVGGQFNDGGNALIGSIDEFRVSNIARYNSNFTPPTSAY